MTNNLTNKSAHTPGPWTVGDPWGHPLTIMWGGDKGAVVNGDGIGDDCELNRANARLIAAAPTMLEALKILVGQSGEGMAFSDRIRNAERAIDAALTPSPPPTQENAG
jgi:hypothetical protein